MSSFLKQNKTYMKSTFYKTFSSIFSSKLIEVSKRDFTTNIEKETFVPYSKFINDLYGEDIEKISIYEILDRKFTKKFLKNKFYFVNRENLMGKVYEQLKINLHGRHNGIVDKYGIGLINFGDNNGTGKTTMLNVLPSRIPSIEIDGKSEKIFYPPIIDVKFKNSVLDTFIISILKSLKPIFNDNEINKNKEFDEDVLDHLSIHIKKYLSSDKKESKEAWEKILNYFYIPTKEPSYIEPKGKVIIFRLDEIGMISLKGTNELTEEENSINIDFDFPLKNQLRKQNLQKMLRLYLLRNYIESFCNTSIDVIVAGKNGFLPFMGNLTFNTSPSSIKNFALEPINNPLDLEKIFKYHLTLHRKNIFETLSNLKTICVKNLNQQVTKFIKCLIDYSGGHPRLIYTILELLDDEENLDKYFNPYSACDSFENMFKKIEKPLFEKTDLLQRMTKTSMMDTIADLVDKKSFSYDILKKDPRDIYLTMMYKLHDYNEGQSNEHIKDSNTSVYLWDILNDLPQEFNGIIGESDIAIALGTPYFTISKNEVKLLFPNVLKNFLFSIFRIKDESSLREKLKRSIIRKYPTDPKIIELAVIDYYKLCFDNNLINYFNIFLHDNNNNGSKLNQSISKNEIKGHSNFNNYSEIIAEQLLNDVILNEELIHIIKPKISNNFGHDFFVLLPTSDGNSFITAVQVKTSKENELIMSGEDIYKAKESIKKIAGLMNKNRMRQIKGCKYLIISNCSTLGQTGNIQKEDKSEWDFVQNLLMKDLIDANKKME